MIGKWWAPFGAPGSFVQQNTCRVVIWNVSFPCGQREGFVSPRRHPFPADGPKDSQYQLFSDDSGCGFFVVMVDSRASMCRQETVVVRLN